MTSDLETSIVYFVLKYYSKQSNKITRIMKQLEIKYNMHL